VDAAGKPGERARETKGGELEAVGRHAHHLGDILVIVDGEQAGAEARVEYRMRDPQRGDGDGEHQQVQRAGRRRRELRHVGHHLDARAAVDLVEHDGGEHEGDGEREEREQLAAQRAHAEHDRSQQQAEQRRAAGRQRQGGEEIPVMLPDQRRGDVYAGAEERAMAEREVARIAAQQIP
jgi:hypothetical protein